MSPRKTLLLALGLLLLIVLSAWVAERNRSQNSVEGEEASSAPLVGSSAPDFSLKTLDGREVKLSSYRRKGPVVLAFWASWCGPCRMEMPMLEGFYKENHSRGMELLAISIDYDPAEARSYAAQYKLPFPVLLDETNQVADSYQARGIPLLYVVDPSGTVRYSHAGFNPAYEAMLMREIDAVR